MTQPWEASTHDTTRALSVYNVLRGMGSSATKTQIYNHLNHHQTSASPLRFGWDQNDGGPLDAPLSTAYVDDGVALLVSLGFVTLVGDTITATNLVSGVPAQIRRVKGDDDNLEYGKPRRPLGNGTTDPP